jgi:hypothetical protein
MRGGAVCHIRAISAWVRPEAWFLLSAFQRLASCLLLAGGDFNQAPNEMGSNRRAALFRLWCGQLWSERLTTLLPPYSALDHFHQINARSHDLLPLRCFPRLEDGLPILWTLPTAECSLRKLSVHP